jgi:hypothetical protein
MASRRASWIVTPKPQNLSTQASPCSDARTSTLLFQFGTRDEVISQEDVREFAPYAGGTNQLKVYESASHYQLFLNPDAFSWLRDQLTPGQ